MKWVRAGVSHFFFWKEPDGKYFRLSNYLALQSVVQSSRDSTEMNEHGTIANTVYLQTAKWARFGPWTIVCPPTIVSKRTKGVCGTGNYRKGMKTHGILDNCNFKNLCIVHVSFIYAKCLNSCLYCGVWRPDFIQYRFNANSILHVRRNFGGEVWQSRMTKKYFIRNVV